LLPAFFLATLLSWEFVINMILIRHFWSRSFSCCCSSLLRYVR
jgi:hypothetical protein